jgi:LemA protein
VETPFTIGALALGGGTLQINNLMAMDAVSAQDAALKLGELQNRMTNTLDLTLSFTSGELQTMKTYNLFTADGSHPLEEIAKMRSMAQNASGVAQAAQAEGQLSQALGRLFAVMENYPQLRANENVMQLQNTLTSLEDEIQLARRYYNGSVREYNTRTEVFPASIVARQYGFQKAEFFELDSVAEREVPQVSF